MKKFLSLFLALILVVGLLVPAVSAEPAETEATTATLTSTIADGDKVVIYNANAKKVMTGEKTVHKGKDQLKSVAATVTDGKMTVPEGALILTVVKDENDK